MKYIWIAGNHPALSFAELHSHVTNDTLLPLSNEAILHETALDTVQILELMKRFGGIIKVAEVFAELEVVLNEDKSVNLDNIIDEIRSKIVRQINSAKGGPASGGKKTDFGLSLYGLKTINPKEIGLTVKKLLKEEGIASRFVPVTVGYALSSASVLNNGLVGKGLEVCLAKQDNKILLARTIAIQELEEFSKFDYGRPDRDTKQGMLPPKLARMMINLSGTDFAATTYDPFCGSGTILTEALRIGYKNMFGSDKNSEAITAAQKNIEWTLQNSPLSKGGEGGLKPNNLKLAIRDARNINLPNRADGVFIEPKSIDAIVSEVFLGPVRSGRETRGDLQRTLHELSELYLMSLLEFRKFLKPGGVVVLALPLYVYHPAPKSGGQVEKHGVILKEIMGSFYQVASVLGSDPKIPKFYHQGITKQGGLVYGRPDQWVQREIVVLRLV